MARFRFSMENLLNMKEKLEEQEKNNYSQANMRLQQAEEELRLTQIRYDEKQQILRGKMRAALNVQEIRQMEQGLKVLGEYEKQQIKMVEQRQRELNLAREKLYEARKERKTFEKLKEKAFQLFLEEENKKEQKEIDELVSYRYGAEKEI
ncbi:MAG: flagellar export protein FliJ [Eubacterium sp.]|nr:flagellar export protein FliJ [Eubacterium sp.]